MPSVILSARKWPQIELGFDAERAFEIGVYSPRVGGGLSSPIFHRAAGNLLAFFVEEGQVGHGVPLKLPFSILNAIS